MKTFLPLLLLAASATADAEKFVDVEISDFNKTYTHLYKTCSVEFLSSVMTTDKYFYATCGTYSAPPLVDSGISTRRKSVYNEIGVNGVEWQNCKLAELEDYGVKMVFHFECNKYEPPLMEETIWRILDDESEVCVFCPID